MFWYGKEVPASPYLTTTAKSIANETSDVFCSDEVKKYKKELDKAEQQINSLNEKLKQVRTLDNSLASTSRN